MNLSELMGVRARILSKTTTKRLSSTDRRLVCFEGQPVGVIQRRAGTMLWFSPRRRFPYTSRADAAMSIVADLFLARRDGGMPAVVALIEAAHAEAAEMDRAIEEMDEANDILDQAIDELGLGEDLVS